MGKAILLDTEPRPRGCLVPEPQFRKVAAATLKAAVIFVNPGIERRLKAIEDWASVIFPSRPEDDVPTRDLQRQIDSVVDRSAQFLNHVSRRDEYRNVATEDLNAVLDTIREVLNDSMSFFMSAELVRRTITPTDAVSVLTPRLQEKWRRALIPESAKEFGRTILDVCCYQLVSWAQQLPAVQNHAAWVTLSNTWALIASTHEILQELRRTGLAQAREPYRIVSSQRRDIANFLGKMELFGLPVESRYRRIPISVSYVTAHGTGIFGGKIRILPFEDVVAGALGLGRRQYAAHGIRLLVKGRAGSGKTTAAQWLAQQSATNQLGDLNRSLGATIPFFVRLRSVMTNQSSIPPDSSLLMSGQLREGLGADWIENMGDGYHPLIVFDGWDELKSSERAVAAAWLSSLCQRFPNGHVIVTSRPEAASDAVFEELKFTETTLALLGQDQKRDLICQWFKGLRKNLQQSPDLDEPQLMEAERSLLRDVQGSALSELTDTPLITAMLCCLYATSTSRNPLNKSALYQKVTTTLIHARDEDRGVHTGPWDELLIGQKEDLLGEIALKMVETGSLQLPKASDEPGASSIEDIARLLLTKFGKSPSVSDALIEAMLDRSMILQRVGNCEGEFVHRTFQEHLSGVLLARRWDWRRLFELVGRDDRYLSVLPFAINSAEQEIADLIIKWLLDRESAVSGNSRRETLFVLLECLAAAKELDPGIREGGIEAGQGVVPPRSSEEARAIASLGDAAVDLLRVERWTPEDDEYCIEALARIGTRNAVDALGGYAKIRGETTKQFLVQAWDRIREANYVETVLSRVSSGMHLSAHTPERLKEIAGVRGASRVTCENLDLSGGLLGVLSDLPALQELTLTGCRGLGDLVEIDRLESLRSLRLEGIYELDHIVRIGKGLLRLEIEKLSASDIHWSVILSRSPDIEVLRVRDLKNILQSAQWRFFADIPSAAIENCKALRVLEFENAMVGHPNDLDFIKELNGLRVLRLSCPVTSAGVERLNSLRRLRTVKISLAKQAEYEGMFSGLGNQLVHLELVGCSSRAIRSLSGFRRLSSLWLGNCSIGAIQHIPPLGSLRELEFRDCIIGASESLSRYGAEPSAVRVLRWYGGSLAELDFIGQFPHLTHLEVVDAYDVHDLSGILQAPDGCQIYISGISEEVDESPIDDLRDSGRCFVNYEPKPVWGEQFDSGES